MKMMKRLIDVYPAGGRDIFSYWGSDSTLPIPWNSFDFVAPTTADLDRLFFATYGQRPISPYLESCVDASGIIPVNDRAGIARFVQSILQQIILRYCAAYAAEYNPAENYNMRETHTGTDSTDRTFDGYKETQTYGHTVESDNTNDVYAYDSGNAVPSDKGKTTTKYKQDAGENGDIREFDGTQTDATTYDSTLTRSGNIGVQTAAQMLEMDFSLWEKNNIWIKICAAAADILTVPIYE
jgi:hypothetical protein